MGKARVKKHKIPKEVILVVVHRNTQEKEMSEERKPTGKRYTEEDRKTYASKAKNYATWKEAGIALGPDYKSLMAWCKKYNHPFPEKKEIKTLEPPTERVKKQRVYRKKIKKNPTAPLAIKLSEDLKKGISNMLADNVCEKIMSLLTGIPKKQIREIINQMQFGKEKK